MKRAIIVAAAMAGLLSVASPVLAATDYLRVNTDILNIRSGPSTNHAIVGKVVEGDQLRLMGEQSGWYKVDLGTAGTGWVKAEYTYKITQPPATQPPTQPAPPDTPPVNSPRPGLGKQVLVSAQATAHNGRDPGYDITIRPRLWERLTYLDSAEGWVQVQNSAGAKGWIDGRKVTLIDAGVAWSQQALYSVKEGAWVLEYLPVREVAAHGTNLSLRSGPSAGYPVQALLQPGQQLKLLAVPGGEYVQVLLPDGATGWVSRTYLKVGAGRTPDGGVKLTQTSPGIMRLEVTGAVSGVTAAADTLTLPLPENPTRAAQVAIGMGGIGSLGFESEGLVMRFTASFRHTMLEQTAGRTVIEIRPVVESIERTEAGGGLTYRFQVGGTVLPSAHRQGAAVVLNLPGARLAGGVTAPAELDLTASAGGLTARVTSERSYAVKRGDGYIDLVLFTPGLTGKTIVVDPGHGGFDPGATGITGLREKDFNISLGWKLHALLEAAGARVIMTRTADTPCPTAEELARVPSAERVRFDLNCRTVVPDTTGADLFVSIHANANPSRSARGTETYWSADNLNHPQSRVLAGLLQQEMVKVLGIPDRGVMEAMFYVIKFTDAPAALVEVAYLSNAQDEALLKQDAVRQQVAESLVRGMARFFGE
jgi:N-acetylmuramoyl-L-alanine amidase